MNQEFEYVGNELEIFARAVRWKRYFAAQLKPYLSGTVLEVGAGLGSTTTALHRDSVVSWTCLEPDSRLAERLRSTIAADPILSRHAIEVAVGTVNDVPAQSLFDTILYIDVLEHIEHDQTEMLAAARHLSANGYLIVLSPAHNWLYSPFDRAIGHYRRYTSATLRGAAPDLLQIVRLRYLDAVGMLASLANRLVLKSGAPTASQIRVWDNWMIPLSRVVDPLLGYCVGKSIIGVWRLKNSKRND